MLIGSMEMHRGLTFDLMATILKQEFCLLAPGPLAPGIFCCQISARLFVLWNLLFREEHSLGK